MKGLPLNRPGIFQQNVLLYFLFCQKMLSDKTFSANALTKLSLGKASWLLCSACLCAENTYDGLSGRGSGHIKACAGK